MYAEICAVRTRLGVISLAEVRLQEGESLENALRRFKRKVQTEDIIKEVKRHSFFLNMIFFTSGQNSAKALPPIRPVIPQTQRSPAFPGLFSLSTRHRFDRKLFPTFPA